MIAHDRGWLRRLREAVSSGLTAEAAVERVQNDARAKLQRQTETYLRDRLHDLTDIANRFLHQLAGQSLVLLPKELPESAILVARSMSPGPRSSTTTGRVCAGLCSRRRAPRAIWRSSPARWRFRP